MRSNGLGRAHIETQVTRAGQGRAAGTARKITVERRVSAYYHCVPQLFFVLCRPALPCPARVTCVSMCARPYSSIVADNSFGRTSLSITSHYQSSGLPLVISLRKTFMEEQLKADWPK
jgi:hypothetical protein